MKSFRIGSLFGIPIKLDLTFLLVLPFFAVLIGIQIEPVVEILNVSMGAGIDPEGVAGFPTSWVLGFIAATGLFVGVLLHELGHALTARRYGYGTDSITLWLFGGLAALSEMPENWRQEFAIAIAGPIVSILVGIGSYALYLFVLPIPEGTVPSVALDGAIFVLGYLAVLNVVLAVFNMLPAFPMDGGRVLRALLARSQPYAKATQQAAAVGKFLAIVMGLVGLFWFNIILIGLAFFVYIAASSESQQVVMRAAFDDVAVADIMTPARDLHTVPAGASITELIQRMVSERHTGYPVLENGHLVGLVTLSDAREVEGVERDAYRVEEIMSTDLKTIDPYANAIDAIEKMQQESIGRLLVVEAPESRWESEPSPTTATEPRASSQQGDLVGIVSRTDVMTALDIIKRTGVADPDRTRSVAD